MSFYDRTINNYLSQLMFTDVILSAMSVARQQMGQHIAKVYWRGGSYETGQYTHCAGRKTGRSGSILAGFANDAYLSNASFYS